MTTVLIRRNAPTDSCHNLTALMPRCTKTSFLITPPHYIPANRNSDNLHNAAFIGYSLVGRVMADEHLIVVLHQLLYRDAPSDMILPRCIIGHIVSCDCRSVNVGYNSNLVLSAVVYEPYVLIGLVIVIYNLVPVF